MADPHKAWPENASGPFFVDTTCIDCDTCRQLAPASFAAMGQHSYVQRQPDGEGEERLAFRALLACPTASIGTTGPNTGARAAMADFPLPIEDTVFYCGFTSRASFGASSYVILREEGNWLVDAPKYHPQVFQWLAAHGGLSHIFLTHEDDVADAARYAAHFGAKRVIHRQALAAQPDAEVVLDGQAPVQLAPDLVALPTPGHTAGHCCLLYQGRVLFSGDHLAWDRDLARLTAHEDACWFDRQTQLRSVEALIGLGVERLLPGHGQAIALSASAFDAELKALLARERANG